MRIGKRILAIMLAAWLCFGPAGAVPAQAEGSPTPSGVSLMITDEYDNAISYIANRQKVNIIIQYTETNPPADMKVGYVYNATSQGFTVGPDWDKSGASISLEAASKNDKNDSYFDVRVELNGVTYKGTRSNKNLVLTVSNATFTEGDFVYSYNPTIRYDISDYLTKPADTGSSGGIIGGNTGSTGSDDAPAPTADIVIESISVTDEGGKSLNEVTKETPSFNISLVYADYGLREYDVGGLPDTDIQVFLTNAGSFVPSGSNRGTITPIVSTSNEVPRFRVTFRNVTWDGASNQISIQVRYSIDGHDFKGDTQASVYQAKSKTEEEEEGSTVPPPTPYIIVTNYSTGEGPIEAGQRFNLDLTFKNTSTLLNLENIVMTVTPDDDLSIATASNTFYIENLAAGALLERSLELEAKPAAKVGSHTINITFTYEYLVTKSKDSAERVAKDSKETIAVPITQIDRFEVDPITEIPGGILGETAYIPVTFTNKGKSATYNISGSVRGNLELIAPAEHYGNLEAGQNDSIDVTVVPQEAGELFGEVVITYEDENTNQKEITVPFTMFVEAPYTPPPPDMNIIDPEIIVPEPSFHPARLVLLIAGGLLMAAPVSLILMKRIKAKGAEDLEDDI